MPLATSESLCQALDRPYDLPMTIQATALLDRPAVSAVSDAAYQHVLSGMVGINGLDCKKHISGLTTIRLGSANVSIKHLLHEMLHGPLAPGEVLRRDCDSLGCQEPTHHRSQSRVEWGRDLHAGRI